MPALVSLVQPENHLDVDLHSHRIAVFHGGGEAPFVHGFHGLLVEAHAKGPSHAQVAWTTIRPDDRRQDHAALEFRFPRFFRVLWLRVEDCTGRTNASTDVVNPAANATADPRPDTRPMPRADSTPSVSAETPIASSSSLVISGCLSATFQRRAMRCEAIPSSQAAKRVPCHS